MQALHFSSSPTSRTDQEAHRKPLEVGPAIYCAMIHLENPNQEMTVYPLDQIAKLSIIKNDLTTLPAEFAQLCQLKEIDLTDNNFSEIPPAVYKLPQLTRLVLNSNRIRRLEIAGQLPALRVLECRTSGVVNLSGQFSRLTSLITLILSNNALKQIPEEVTSMNLQTLELDYNYLERLPQSLGRLTTLRKLNLLRNHLSMLPESIGSLPSLSDLDLGMNRITGQALLPLSPLTSLFTLKIAGNKLSEKDIPATLLKRSQEAALSIDILPQYTPAVSRIVAPQPRRHAAVLSKDRGPDDQMLPLNAMVFQENVPFWLRSEPGLGGHLTPPSSEPCTIV